MGKLDFPWTIILFVSFIWQVYVFSANSVCSEGEHSLEIYVSSYNLLILLLIVSRCGLFIYLFLVVCVRVVLGEFLGTRFFHSFFSVPFRSIANPILVYLFWQVCVCSAKGDTPLDPRSSFSFFFSAACLSF